MDLKPVFPRLPASLEAEIDMLLINAFAASSAIGDLSTVFETLGGLSRKFSAVRGRTTKFKRCVANADIRAKRMIRAIQKIAAEGSFLLPIGILNVPIREKNCTKIINVFVSPPSADRAKGMFILKKQWIILYQGPNRPCDAGAIFGNVGRDELRNQLFHESYHAHLQQEPNPQDSEIPKGASAEEHRKIGRRYACLPDEFDAEGCAIGDKIRHMDKRSLRQVMDWLPLVPDRNFNIAEPLTDFEDYIEAWRTNATLCTIFVERLKNEIQSAKKAVTTSAPTVEPVTSTG